MSIRWTCIIAVIAAVIGLVSVAMGIYGYRLVSHIQRLLSVAGVFDNPAYGNITADAWRSGFTNAMIVCLAFGIWALVAAVGLFYERRWGRYLWFTLIVAHMFNTVPDLPQDIAAWAALLVSTVLFALSWLALRKPHVRTKLAP